MYGVHDVSVERLRCRFCDGVDGFFVGGGQADRQRGDVRDAVDDVDVVDAGWVLDAAHVDDRWHQRCTVYEGVVGCYDGDLGVVGCARLEIWRGRCCLPESGVLHQGGGVAGIRQVGGSAAAFLDVDVS